MKKQIPIQIILSNRCSENWDEMTPNKKGKYCAHCQKTVIDFSTWSDDTLYNFFTKDRSNVCGMYASSQLNRPIQVPQQSHSLLYRMFVGLGLVLVFTLAAQAQPSPGELKGLVIDNKGKPVINAIIKIFSNHKVIATLGTNLDGEFDVKVIDPGSYDVAANYKGFKKSTVTDVLVDPDKTSTVNFHLVADSGKSNSAIVQKYKRPLIDPYAPGATTNICRQGIVKLPTKDTTNVVTPVGKPKTEKKPENSPTADEPGKTIIKSEQIEHRP